MASLVRRIFTSTPVLICMLLGWGLVLAAGVAVFALRERPEWLREYVQKAMSEQLPGYALSMGRLSPALWPSPGVSVEELVLRAPDGSAVLADTASVHFSWAELLTGSVLPTRVRLESAYVLFKPVKNATAVPEALPAEQRKLTGPEAALAALTGLNGLALEFTDTSVDIRLEGKNLLVAGLSGELNAPSGQAAGMLGVDPGRCNLTWQTLSTEGLGPKLELSAGKLNINELRLSPAIPWLVRTGSLNFSARGAMGPYLRNVDLTLTAGLSLTAGPPDIRGEMGINGTTLINNIPVPVNVKIPFGSRDVRQNVDIRNASLVMEDNRLSLTATWLPDDNSLIGKVDVTKLSLPRWFAFGRDLPTGLVAALDDINGSFKFRMNAKSLDAPDLRLNLRGIPFTGRGGVPDFSRPEIQIEASTAKADLNKIFPELTEQVVSGPTFAQPPLLGGEAKTAGADAGPDVSFDIRLKSEEAVFWKFSGREFQFRLTPVWEKEHVSMGGVRIDASLGNFYNGKVQAVFRTRSGLDLGLSLTGVDSERLSAVMVRGGSDKRQRAAPFGGRLDVKADLRGKGSGLASILAGLNGSLNATLTGGFFGTGSERREFSRFVWRADELTGTASSRLTALPATLPYTARWRLEFAAPKNKEKPVVSFVADARGRLDFATDTWLPVSGREMRIRTSGSVQEVPFNLEGKAGGDHSELHFTEVGGRAGGADIAFNLVGSHLATKPRWQVSGSVAVSNLRSTLAGLGIALPSTPETSLRRAEVTGKLVLEGDALRLEGLSGMVDDTDFSGSLTKEMTKGSPKGSGKKPYWTVDLQLGTLDLDRYLEKNTSAPVAPASKWDLTFLRETELSGSLRLKKFMLLDMPLVNCRVPIKLTGGVFSVDPFVADAADGSAFMRLRAEVMSEGLGTRIQSELKGVNMLTLRREDPEKPVKPKDRSRIAGKGTFLLDVSGLLRSGADLPGGLSGTWSARIDNGYMESGNSRRFFRSVSATGPMRSGVLDSRDMFVNGHNFMVRGQGSVDLVRGQLNYQLNASLPGVPNVPISYTGPLSNPKRNINALSALGGVLANVGQGVFSILDGVLTAPFRLIN